MRTAALCLLLVFTQHGIADWQLNSDRSAVTFVSIKNNQIAEVHRFLKLSGSVTSEGLAQLDITLASVESNIPIRNDRMKSMLFESDSFAVASTTARINIDEISGLAVGASLQAEITYNVDLHGMRSPINSKTKITRVSESIWQVASVQPMIVNASAFKLVQGIEALRAIAGLASIGTAVPVTFSLEFTKQ